MLPSSILDEAIPARLIPTPPPNALKIKQVLEQQIQWGSHALKTVRVQSREVCASFMCSNVGRV